MDAGEEGEFPYTDPRIYAAEVVEHMLQINAIKPEHCKAGLQAQRRMSCERLEELLGVIKGCWWTIVMDRLGEGEEAKKAAEKCQKAAILALVGMWNCTSQHVWKIVKSTYQTDAGATVVLRRPLADGAFEFKCCTELHSLYSMAPWGRIALDVEQMRISQAWRVITDHPDCLFVGAHGDGTYFTTTSWDAKDLKDELTESVLFDDGEPVFQIKREDLWKVPNYEQRLADRSLKMTFE